MRTPVIQVSQVGYHPAQPKQVIIELDPRDTKRDNVKLQRIASPDRSRPSSIASPRSGVRFPALSVRTPWISAT